MQIESNTVIISVTFHDPTRRFGWEFLPDIQIGITRETFNGLMTRDLEAFETVEMYAFPSLDNRVRPSIHTWHEI